MGKGARLRALRANAPAVQLSGKEKVEPTISNMKNLTRIKASEAPEGNRAQRRAEERAERHEAALEAQYPTNRTIWGRQRRQLFQHLRVAKRILGEATSINKARAADFRARRATMEVR